MAGLHVRPELVRDVPRLVEPDADVLVAGRLRDGRFRRGIGDARLLTGTAAQDGKRRDDQADLQGREDPPRHFRTSNELDVST